MDILVYGAGAIGSLLGGYLAQAGHRVTLLGRPTHMQAVRKQGLKIKTPDDCWQIPIRTSQDLIKYKEKRGIPDATVLAVKAYDMDETLKDLNDHLFDHDGGPAKTTVLCLQNGIGNEQRAARSLPNSPVVSAAVTISASIETPGEVIQHRREAGLTFAPYPDDRHADSVEAANQWQDILSDIPWIITRAHDYQRVKWSKLLLNLVGNATATILETPPAEALHQRGVYRLERAALRETIEVMEAASIDPLRLPPYQVRRYVLAFKYLPNWILHPLLVRQVGGARGKRPSLLKDLKAGRHESEITYLNGAVMKKGAQLGLDTPVNRFLTQTVQQLFQSEGQDNPFRGNMDYFLRTAAEETGLDLR